MKKFLLSLALLAGVTFMGEAQLAFQYEGESLPNGATIDFPGYKSEIVTEEFDIKGQIYTYYAVKYLVDPEIHLISGSDAEATVISSSNVAVNLCAGGNCINGTYNSKPEVILTKDVPLNLQMDWAYSGTPDLVLNTPDIEVPKIRVTLTAYYNNDPSNKITLTVNMGGFTAAVENISGDNNEVTVAGKSLNFNVDSPAQMSVYSISGKTVINRSVNGNGTISLDALPAGIYIYKLAGKKPKTGKFIIK